LFSLQTSTLNETHENVQSVVTQQVSTGVASCSTDNNIMSHIEDSQQIAISVMCTNLNISAGDLLIKDVTTHNELMKVLADVAISVNEYFELSTEYGKVISPSVKRTRQYLSSTAT